MPKPGVYRSPWHDFPDVVIQTTVHNFVAAQELTLLKERQLSLERTNAIDPPSQPC